MAELTMRDMLKVSMGTPELGAVNFRVLYEFLEKIIVSMGIAEEMMTADLVGTLRPVGSREQAFPLPVSPSRGVVRGEQGGRSLTRKSLYKGCSIVGMGKDAVPTDPDDSEQHTDGVERVIREESADSAGADPAPAALLQSKRSVRSSHTGCSPPVSEKRIEAMETELKRLTTLVNLLSHDLSDAKRHVKNLEEASAKMAATAAVAAPVEEFKPMEVVKSAELERPVLVAGTDAESSPSAAIDALNRNMEALQQNMVSNIERINKNIQGNADQLSASVQTKLQALQSSVSANAERIENGLQSGAKTDTSASGASGTSGMDEQLRTLQTGVKALEAELKGEAGMERDRVELLDAAVKQLRTDVRGQARDASKAAQLHKEVDALKRDTKNLHTSLRKLASRSDKTDEAQVVSLAGDEGSASGDNNTELPPPYYEGDGMPRSSGEQASTGENSAQDEGLAERISRTMLNEPSGEVSSCVEEIRGYVEEHESRIGNLEDSVWQMTNELQLHAKKMEAVGERVGALQDEACAKRDVHDLASVAKVESMISEALANNLPTIPTLPPSPPSPAPSRKNSAGLKPDAGARSDGALEKTVKDLQSRQKQIEENLTATNSAVQVLGEKLVKSLRWRQSVGGNAGGEKEAEGSAVAPQDAGKYCTREELHEQVSPLSDALAQQEAQLVAMGDRLATTADDLQTTCCRVEENREGQEQANKDVKTVQLKLAKLLESADSEGLMSSEGGPARNKRDRASIADVGLSPEAQRHFTRLSSDIFIIKDQSTSLKQDIDKLHQKMYDTDERVGGVDNRITQLQSIKADKLEITKLVDIKADKKMIECFVTEDYFNRHVAALDQDLKDCINNFGEKNNVFEIALSELAQTLVEKFDSFDIGALFRYVDEKMVNLQPQIIEAKPIEDQAAGTRKFLFPHMHCISCDRNIDGSAGNEAGIVVPFIDNFPPSRHVRKFSERGFSKDAIEATIYREGLQQNMLRLVRAADMDEMATKLGRHCGGQHTAVVMDGRGGLGRPAPLGPVPEFVQPLSEADVRGRDGHIYKGRIRPSPLPGIPKHNSCAENNPGPALFKKHSNSPVGGDHGAGSGKIGQPGVAQSILPGIRKSSDSSRKIA